jgi:hypothetical protein
MIQRSSAGSGFQLYRWFAPRLLAEAGLVTAFAFALATEPVTAVLLFLLAIFLLSYYLRFPMIL